MLILQFHVLHALRRRPKQHLQCQERLPFCDEAQTIVLTMKDKWWIAIAPSDHFWEWCLFCAENSAKMLQEKEICFAVTHFLSFRSVGTVIYLFLVILVCSGATTHWTYCREGDCSKNPAAKTLWGDPTADCKDFWAQWPGFSKPLQFEAWVHPLSHGINPEAESLNAFLL